MTRESTDELAPDGSILNGYDYNLQNWVVEGILVHVGNAKEFWDLPIKSVPNHEVRKEK